MVTAQSTDCSGMPPPCSSYLGTQCLHITKYVILASILIVFNGYYPYHQHVFSGSPLDAVASV